MRRILTLVFLLICVYVNAQLTTINISTGDNVVQNLRSFDTIRVAASDYIIEYYEGVTYVFTPDSIFYVEAGSGSDTVSAFGTLQPDYAVLLQRTIDWSEFTVSSDSVIYSSWGSSGAIPHIDVVYIDSSTYKGNVFKNIDIDTTVYLGTPTPSDDSLLAFQSGFENDVLLTHDVTPPSDSAYYRFSGADNTLDTLNDWTNTIGSGKTLTNSWILLGSDTTMALNAPSIATDPLNIANKVLKYEMTTANDYFERAPNLRAARTQMDIVSGAGTIDSLLVTYKMLIPSSFDTLADKISTAITWMTLGEYWDDASGDIFRTTLTLHKYADSLNYNFQLTTQAGVGGGVFYTWMDTIMTDYTVPYDKWIDIEFNIIEGDSLSGRLYYTVSDELNGKDTLLNLVTRTESPYSPTAGIEYFSPLKLYTFGYYADTLRTYGSSLKVYYDDLKIYNNKVIAPDIP